MTRDLFADDLAETRARAEAQAAAEQRLRDHEADFTPRPVIETCLAGILATEDERGETLLERIRQINDVEGRAFEVLDVGAGEGGWSSCVLRLAQERGLDVRITAVELREEAREHLARFAHRVVIGPWQTALGLELIDGVWAPGEGGRAEFDLVVGNPPFSEARCARRSTWPAATGPVGKSGRPKVTQAESAERRRQLQAYVAGELDPASARLVEGLGPGWAGSRPLLEALAEYDPEQSMPALCLASAPITALYTTQQCYTKTASGWLLRLAHPYAATLELPSSVGHRGRAKGQDDKPYAVFVWTREGGRTGARSRMLPMPKDRQFDLRPGAEPAEWLAARGYPALEGR